MIVIQFMLNVGHKYFLSLPRAHFNPRLMARAKISLSRAEKIFMPANINSIVLLFLNVIPEYMNNELFQP